MKTKNLVNNARSKVIWIILLTLIGTMFAGTTIMAEEEFVKDYKVGDINRDGNVNAIDLANLRGYLLGTKGYSEIIERKWEADVDGNGEINSIDFAYLRQLVLGIIDKLPKQTEISNPTPKETLKLFTPDPQITPSPTMPPRPKATMPAPYLPQPSTDPNKILTHIKNNNCNLVIRYPSNSKSFSVNLYDSDDNPVVGRKINVSGIDDTAVTDSNGEATFNLNINYDPNIFYREWYSYIDFYFEGDETYNPSVLQDYVKVSNNGGTPELIPLPSPEIDENKINTYVMTVESEPVYLTSNSCVPVTLNFEIKLVDENGNPIEGKVVGWQNNFPNFFEEKELAVTDSNGVAVFSFIMPNMEDAPYIEYDSYVNLYFDGDDTYNPSVYRAKVIASRKG